MGRKRRGHPGGADWIVLLGVGAFVVWKAASRRQVPAPSTVHSDVRAVPEVPADRPVPGRPPDPEPLRPVPGPTQASLVPSRRKTPGSESAPPLGYQPTLDALRALAIVPVVLFHAFRWPAGGYLGVDLFFVLSGFLITTLLVEEQRRHGDIRLLLFYLRRVLRLVPALWVMIAVVVGFVIASSGSIRHGDLAGAVQGLTYTENIFDVNSSPNYFSHLWSLGVEEQFYIVWPVLLIAGMRFLPRGALFATGLGIAALAAAARLLVLPEAWSLSMRFDSILIGCAAALLCQQVPRVRALGGRFALAVIGVLIVFFIVGRGDFAGRWTTTAFSLTAAVALFGILDSRAPSPLVFLGRISYAIYLWHIPVIRITNDSRLPDTLGPNGARAFALAATLLLATASYYVVEEPFLRRKWRLARTSSHDSAIPRMAHAAAPQRLRLADD